MFTSYVFVFVANDNFEINKDFQLTIELKSTRLLQRLIKQREKAEVYNISTGQCQSSSGLLGKTTNLQNIYYCKIINGSYMVWRGKVWLVRKINQKTGKDYTANVAPDTSLDKTSRALESYFMVKKAIWSFLTSLGVRLTEPTIWLCEGEIRTVFIKRFSCRLLPGKEKRTSPFFSNWFGKCGNSYPHQRRCIELDMYPYSL